MVEQIIGTEARRQEGGFVLVSAAALLVVLIGFLALGVSMGYLYSARTTAQEIGDAAALTGAYTYITTPDLDPAEAKTLAEYHAEQFALARAGILGVDLDASDVTPFADVPNRRVEVTIASEQPTFFGRVLGVNTADVQTYSLAEAGSVAAGETCTRPFFIPNNVFRPETEDDEDRCIGCSSESAGEQLLVFDDPDDVPDLGWIETQFAKNIVDPDVDAVPDHDPDSLFRLYPGDPGGAISPGQFYLIDLVVGEPAGADDIADWIRDCDPAVNRTECSEFYSVKTGATAGGVKNGLFGHGIHAGLLPTPPDVYDPATGAITSGDDGEPTNGSKQMIMAPIWDTCDTPEDIYCMTGDIGSGTGVTMQIVGYAQIFLEGPDPGPGPDDVSAYLIDVIGCGELPDSVTGEDPDLAGSTVLGRPLRLVLPEPPSS